MVNFEECTLEELTLLERVRLKLIRDCQENTMGFSDSYFDDLVLWIARNNNL